MKTKVKLLVLLGFLVSVLGGAAIFAQTPDTAKVQYKLGTLQNGKISEQTDFEVGLPIPAVADVAVSGAPQLANAKIRLTVPKLGGKLEFTTAAKFLEILGYSNQLTEDDTNWYMTYGGDMQSFRATLEFPFRFKDGVARNGDTATVKLEILDANQADQVLYETTKTYKAISNEKPYNDSTFQLLESGNKVTPFDDNLPLKGNRLYTYTETVPQNQIETTGSYYFIVGSAFDYPNEHNTKLGLDLPENIVYEIALPKELEYNPKTSQLRNGQYDPQTHTVTLTVAGAQSTKMTWYDNRGRYYIENYANAHFTSGTINVNKVKFDQTYTLKAKYTYNKGLPNEYTLPERTVYVRHQKAAFQATHNGTPVGKAVLDGTADINGVRAHVGNGNYKVAEGGVYDSWQTLQNSLGMLAIGTVTNVNNGSDINVATGGRTSALYAIQDNLEVTTNNQPNKEDKRTYYKFFRLTSAEQSRDAKNKLSKEENEAVLGQVKDAAEKNTLYGVMADGTKEVIKQNITLGEFVPIDDVNQKYTNLYLAFENPIILNNTTLTYHVGKMPTVEEMTKIEDGTYNYQPQKYYTSASFIIHDENTNHPATADAAKQKDSGITTNVLSLSNPQIQYVGSSGSQEIIYSKDGTTFKQNAQVLLTDFYLGSKGKEDFNVKVIKLLPPGYEYVSHESLPHPQRYYALYGKTIEEPQIIRNYKDTGKTAVIYSLDMNYQKQDRVYANINTNIKIIDQAPEGQSTIETYVVWEKDKEIKPDIYQTGYHYTDVLDINNDGNTNQRFLLAKNTVNYRLPLVISLSKGVSTQADGPYHFDATGDLGASAYYRLNIFNNTISKVDSVSLIDVLPAIGDHRIVSNQDGAYLPRQSAFGTPLNSFIEDLPENNALLALFDVFYQVTPQGSNLASVRDGQWLTKDQVINVKSVKSIKYVLKQGKSLGVGQTVSAYLKVDIPKETGHEKVGQKAINTVAFSTDDNNYLESNPTSLAFAKYTVSGIYFEDVSQNGFKDPDEKPVANQIVELIDEETGEVALGIDNQPLRTTTQDNGEYRFILYKRGNYRVRFTKRPDQTFSDVTTMTDSNSNHLEVIENDQAKTKVVTINPANPNIQLNGALLIEKRDIEVIKQDQDNKALLGAVFELQEMSGQVLQTQTTNDEGKLTFSKVPFGQYKIIEKTAPTGYQIDEINGREITVGKDPITLAPFMNTLIKGSVRLTKVDAEKTDKTLENVTFALKQGDQTKYQEITNNEGIATFENVLQGEYTLVELITQPDYTLSKETKTVRIDTHGQVIDLGQIGNTIKKSTVTTKYVNEAGDEIKVADTQENLAVNSNYKTTKENELEHGGKLYRLDTTQLPDNAEGKVTEAPITVTYRYKLVTGTVTTKYVNEAGDEIKVADTQENLAVNSNYKTTKENELEHGGKLYRLDTTQLPDNAEGKVTEAPITVTYRYKLVTGTVTTKYVNEAGDEIKVADTQENLAVNSNYKTTKENELEHGGKLYRLDTTQLPDNAEGKVTEAPITVTYRYKLVTGTVTTKYVNEAGDEIKVADTQENLAVNSNYKTTKENELEHGGKLYRLDTTQLPDNAEGKVTEAPITVTYRYKLVTGTVTTKYVNEAGDEIKVADTQADLAVNSNYKTTKENELKHDGKLYRLDETKLPDNAEGKVTEAPITVTYRYKLVTGTVTTKYMNESGEEIKPADTQANLVVNSNYKTTKENELEHDGKLYRLDETKLPDNAEGKVTEAPITVTYRYKLVTGTVTTKYVNEAGDEIKVADTQANLTVNSDYTTSRDDEINHDGKVYRLDKTQEPDNAKGKVVQGSITVIYTYRLATSVVITEYVDDQGTPLQPATTQSGLPINANYVTTAKDQLITSNGLVYRLNPDKAPVNAKGSVTAKPIIVRYYYLPVRGTVTVTFIDQDTGQEIAAPTTPYNSVIAGTAYDVTSEAPKTLTQNGIDYDLVGIQTGNPVGQVPEGNHNVIYTYKRVIKKGSVVVHFIDEATGQRLQGSLNPITAAEEGTDYDVSHLPPSVINRGGESYELVGLQAGSSATGKVVAQTTEVTYLYRQVPKRGSVVLQYVNEASGLPLQDPVTVLENLVVQTPFDVTGRAPEMLTVNGVSYRLVGLDSGSSAKGTITVGITTVTYVYKELPKLGSVKLHFVDKTTKQAIQNPITVVTDQPVGTDYDVTSQAPKELVIDGNQYKRVGLHSGVATGNIIEGETHVVFLYEAIKKTTTTESVPPREPQNPTDKEKSPKTHSIEKGNSSTTKDKEKKEDKIEESHSKSSSKPSESQKANLPKTGEMSHPFEIVGYSMLISLWLLKKDGLKKKKSN